MRPLPITTVVYSHSHLDHIGGAARLLVDAHLAGRELRIVGNVSTVTELRRYGYQAPLPTEVVALPRGGFLFEGEPIELVTPPFGHTRDNSIVLVPRERLAHNVDVVYPGRLPAERLGQAEDLRGLEMALQELLAQRWDLLNAGHGCVGVHADVLFVLGYLGELRHATLHALQQVPAGDFVHDAMSYNWSKAHRDAVADQVIRRLRRADGSLPFAVLVVTGAAEVIAPLRSELGPQAVLEKPFDIVTLAARVKSLAGGAAQGSAHEQT